jgi:beta-N-acetylhexosaminidase
MLATAKHFPGHGDTQIDSHISMPVITARWQRLDTLELVPFRAAVEAGAAFVMSAHIAVPAIGGNGRRPATLDPELLSGVLRDSLHFHGVVITDALDMGGIVTTYGPGEAAVLAFEAGADVLLKPADPRQAIDALTDAVESGRISFDRLDRSLRRLLFLKLRLGLFANRTVPLDSVPGVVGSARFLQAARDIAQRSITLAEDQDGIVDSLRAQPRSLALLTYGEDNAGTVGATLQKELRNAGHRVTLFRLWPASGTASFDSARAVIRSNPYVVFAASVRAVSGKGTIDLPEPVAKLIDDACRKRPTVLVSLGSPYIGTRVRHLRAYLLAWASNPVTEWAASGALTGAPITGHLPVSIPPAFSIGAGLVRGWWGQR